VHSITVKKYPGGTCVCPGREPKGTLRAILCLVFFTPGNQNSQPPEKRERYRPMTNVIPFRPRAAIEADIPAVEHVPYMCDFYQAGSNATVFACLPLLEGQALERFMRNAFSALGATCCFDTERVGENLIIDVCGPAGVCMKAIQRIWKYRDAANAKMPSRQKTSA
jgi:hypothetical protein